MATRTPVKPPERDPVSVIGLIYRILDEPRRALTLLSVLLPVLAVISQVITARAAITGVPAPVIWWAVTALWEISWWTGVRVARRKRSQGQLPLSNGDRANARRP
jgi:hypothetical protein